MEFRNGSTRSDYYWNPFIYRCFVLIFRFVYFFCLPFRSYIFLYDSSTMSTNSRYSCKYLLRRHKLLYCWKIGMKPSHFCVLVQVSNTQRVISFQFTVNIERTHKVDTWPKFTFLSFWIHKPYINFPKRPRLQFGSLGLKGRYLLCSVRYLYC